MYKLSLRRDVLSSLLCWSASHSLGVLHLELGTPRSVLTSQLIRHMVRKAPPRHRQDYVSSYCTHTLTLSMDWCASKAREVVDTTQLQLEYPLRNADLSGKVKLYPTVLCRRVSFLVVDSQLEQNVFALGPCWSGEDQHRPRGGYLHLVSQARPQFTFSILHGSLTSVVLRATPLGDTSNFKELMSLWC